ncbi:MAG TPA: translation initiation factor IF-3 [Patescibacteria group bacterium]|nr:translation initiation factor IF-3 [Patescibacteria group bacterium]
MLQKTRINHQIRAKEVRVISESGESLGVYPLSDALKVAFDHGLDLVEVSPVAQPPVCKLINYDKFRYQQKKLLALQRKNAKKVEVKTIRLSLRISEHDLGIKAKQANGFLEDGDMVKVEIRMRGRELAMPGYAFDRIKAFTESLTTPNRLEVPPKRMGNTVAAVYAPVK